MTAYATRLANSLDTAARMRRADGIPLTPAGAAGLARSGLRPDGGGVVAITSGTMNVTVQPFAAWIDGATSDAQGGYPFVSDAVENLTVAAGHATLARVDTVVAQVRDNAFDGSGFTDARVYILQGSPGSGAPALPPRSAIALRDINVPAGASAGTGGLTAANLGADRRQYVAAIGGVLPVATQAERDALTSPQEGWAVYRKDTDQLQIYDGGAWRTYARTTDVPVVQAGTHTTAAVVAAGATGNIAINFPVAFATAPKVQATPNNSRLNVAVTSITNTGFTLSYANWTGSATATVAAYEWTATVTV